uniref:F-box domain-containing protein n=1 Tax=Plectus sambesii TaxID=2011161 RepID=A0A914XH67_9BILA
MPNANSSAAQKAAAPPSYRRRRTTNRRKPSIGSKYKHISPCFPEESPTKSFDELNRKDDDETRATRPSSFDSLPLLPMALLCKYLSLDDQRNFRRVCRRTAHSTNMYWASRQQVALGADLQRLFPHQLPEYKLNALHTVRPQVVRLLKLIPSGALRSFDWRPLRAIDVASLRAIVDSSGRTARQLFGNVVTLNLRGCTFGKDELAWLAEACPAVHSVVVSEQNVRRDTIENGDETADNALVADTVCQLSWLRKNGHLLARRTRLLAALLRSFPQLENIVVAND